MSDLVRAGWKPKLLVFSGEGSNVIKILFQIKKILMTTKKLSWPLPTATQTLSLKQRGCHSNYYYTPGIYADGYIVFACPFVCSFLR